ncbi:Hypothetical predicted protein [Octopus vulgaris]|uniref:Uncharacterized protein n=1 Tax=Octopus vulgaris TaxID=6645 RepID=A0AA36AXJ7_OCTVU|nr:Hypothetical predicted protein [Octopus vulgaris]
MKLRDVLKQHSTIHIYASVNAEVNSSSPYPKDGVRVLGNSDKNEWGNFIGLNQLKVSSKEKEKPIRNQEKYYIAT